MTPGVAWRSLAIISVTLKPGSWPPSPGLAPWATLISISRQLVEIFGGDAEAARGDLLDRGVGVVAVRPRLDSASGSSPPSPESDLAPMRFMAMLSVPCASGDSAPSDMPGVTKRLRISVMRSTSSIGDRRAALARNPSRSRRSTGGSLAHRLAVALEGLIGFAGHRALQHVDQARLPRHGSRRRGGSGRSRRSAAPRNPRPRRGHAARSTFCWMPARPMPEMREGMLGKYSATSVRDRPTASKLEPPR